MWASTISNSSITSCLIPSILDSRERGAGPAVKVMLYSGDCFEEEPEAAYSFADGFKACELKAILLHDNMTSDAAARKGFDAIARRTGGVCVDFHGADHAANSASELRHKNTVRCSLLLPISGARL
jgi:hypothetical protein